MISNSGHDERNKYNGGTAGDQTGGEWAIIGWYNRPWNYILRHPNAKVREKIAELAEKAAKNNKIGYDQNQRTTFWTQLKAVNYDPAAIKTACEADCSAGVAAIAKATGHLLGIEEMKNISKDCYTGNLRPALKNAGFEVLTASKYLTSDKYLLRGDILLYEYHHTAINLTDGSKTDDAATPTTNSTSDNVEKGQAWLNSNYGTLLKNNLGSKLKVDGSYESESRKGALCVWKDVVNRKYGANLTTNNFNFYESSKKAAEKAVMRVGDSGTLPYIIQFILAGKGLYAGKMDANYLSGTKEAVKEFQRQRGLKVDGICGPDTWYALFN